MLELGYYGGVTRGFIMFTAHADLKARADNEPAIDGFVLKTESKQLLPLAQRLAGLGVPPT